MSIPAFLEARRSIRAFRPDSVPRAALTTMLESACIAPAPHHSRPWRWVAITNAAAKASLAQAMGDQWRIDLASDGVEPERIDALLEASAAKIHAAPAIVLGCLTWNGLDSYPDAQRQHAEFGMALLSLGAAVENLMLCAADQGYASCWVAAPIFCPDAARDALRLPHDWRPHAMVFIGVPDSDYVGRPRPPIALDDLTQYFQ